MNFKIACGISAKDLCLTGIMGIVEKNFPLFDGTLVT